MPGTPTFLKICNLTKNYGQGRSPFAQIKAHVAAVDNVSLDILKGECIALVGESGSGKTTLAQCVLRLIEPNEGSVLYDGIDLLDLPEKKYRNFRPMFQMIYQDALQSLNPRQSIGESLVEPLRVHNKVDKGGLTDRIKELLELVGLEEEQLSRYPHELSGGERKRVVIARALTTKPVFLIADEPTASLDAALKLQIVNVLKDLQRRVGLTLLIISHDLAMVSHIANRTAVMYRGGIVEISATGTLVHSPLHPYTKLLVRSTSHDFDRQDSVVYEEEPVFHKSTAAQRGCKFVDRCPWAESICASEEPLLRKVSEHGSVSCHLAEKIQADSDSPEYDSVVTIAQNGPQIKINNLS